MILPLFFFFLVCAFWPQGMWDINSLARDQTCTPSIRSQNLNRWTTKELLDITNQVQSTGGKSWKITDNELNITLKLEPRKDRTTKQC